MTARAALLALVTLSGCGHPLVNGAYTITQIGPPSVDTCHVFPAEPPPVDAWLTTTGEEIQLDLALFGSNEPQVRTIGRFKRPVLTEADGFSTDGSIINRVQQIGEASCPVPFGQVHLEAIADESSDGAFHGELEIDQRIDGILDARCPMSCHLRVAYTARAK